ncbi:MAG: DUF58 domain-containing protein [Armatimonadia bacterium]|nr:DUF58 domain-containing protein [Armatimonadia bacterium]
MIDPRTDRDEAAAVAEVMARVRRIEIVARQLVETLFAGQYQSAFRGRGLEFAEVREYDESDDHRSIDWNVTARTGDLHVRRYEEERELSTMLLVDVSGSQAFGTGELLKRDLAANVCALVAFAALRNNDKVGAVLFSNTVEHFMAPRKGRNHALHLIRDVLFVQPTSVGTDLAGALRFVTRAVRKRSVLFVLSDFLAPDYEKELRIAAARHDVICAVTHDPMETTLPEGLGLVAARDPETGAECLVDTDNPAVREAYTKARADRLPTLTSHLTACGADPVVLSTDDDMLSPLARLFRLRALRGGRRRAG